jgi:hypothetical protein
MRRELQRLMERCKAEAIATETEAATLRSMGYMPAGDEWSSMLADLAARQPELRRLQLAAVMAKIAVCDALAGQSQALATAGRAAAELIEAAERARDDVLEKTMTDAPESGDVADDTERTPHQTAVYYTTMFFDEVVTWASEILDAAEEEVGGLWSTAAKRP